MPLLVYACASGHSQKKLVRQVKDAPASLPCVKLDCDSPATRRLTAPSQSSKITVDNGHQARAIEILPNIVEINEERSAKDYRNED